MDLRELLATLRTRWITIVVTAVLGSLAGLSLSLLVPPKYESTVQYYVTLPGSDSAASAYQGSLGAQQRVQSYAALATSRDVIQKVLDIADVGIAPVELARNASATADTETVLLDLTIQHQDPQVAVRIAEAYGEVLPERISELETPDGGGAPLARLSVVSPPVLPSEPVSPNTVLNIAVGFVVGLLLGIGAVLVSTALDRRVKSKEEVEKITASTVVGSIPFRKSEDKQAGAEHIVPFRDGHSPAAEAFRRLRTNLQFLNVDSPPKVLVITSSVALEGKSESAVNLSLVLAEAGHKVLLIEADLRRPRVVNYLAMTDQVGLTNVLSAQASFADVVQQTKYSGVDLLACGPLPPNPSELLASDVAGNLMAELRTQYDYVIIDSPPLLPVTDGALLARLADGALLVVREGRTKIDQVAQSTDNLRKADAQLLGVVLVASKPIRRGTSGYYDSYYYSSKTAPVAAN